MYRRHDQNHLTEKFKKANVSCLRRLYKIAEERREAKGKDVPD